MPTKKSTLVKKSRAWDNAKVLAERTRLPVVGINNRPTNGPGARLKWVKIDRIAEDITLERCFSYL